MIIPVGWYLLVFMTVMEESRVATRPGEGRESSNPRRVRAHYINKNNNQLSKNHSTATYTLRSYLK